MCNFSRSNYKSGYQVSAQDREPQNGLYPVTLTTHAHAEAYRTDEKQFEANRGQSENIHIFFTNIPELREQLSDLHNWAGNMIEEKVREREIQIELDTHDLEKHKTQYAHTFLARFYLKEGISDFERWHNKLGHHGAKILARCKRTKSKNS